MKYQSIRSTLMKKLSLLLFIHLSFHIPYVNSSGSSGTSTIPRSNRHSTGSLQIDGESRASPHTYPPWNPSKKIDADGFLNSLYPLFPGEWEKEAALSGRHSGARSRRTLRHQFARIRQVPGDGNCLFHALSTCLSLQVNGTHADMRNTTLLSMNSALLRCLAVDCFSRKPRRILFLQGEEYLRSKDLVEAAAAQYNITGETYCELMRRDSYWGGGPEIVALCNVLRRPIHVYELMEDNLDEYYENEKDKRNSPGFRLRRMACFGSPKFDRKEPLHILSADSRFPDVTPGRQMTSGNHFLAMFPIKIKRQRSSPNQTKRNEKFKVRGGKSKMVSEVYETKKNSSLANNNAYQKHKKGAATGNNEHRWRNRVGNFFSRS